MLKHHTEFSLLLYNMPPVAHSFKETSPLAKPDPSRSMSHATGVSRCYHILPAPHVIGYMHIIIMRNIIFCAFHSGQPSDCNLWPSLYVLQHNPMTSEVANI
jgi:hypothetical protein